MTEPLAEWELELLNTAAGNGKLTLGEWDEVDRLTEDDLVTVTLRVPQQFYDFTVPRREWDDAVRLDRVQYLLDEDMSDIVLDEELYGPDGQQVEW